MTFYVYNLITKAREKSVANGETLYLDELPAQWTLELDATPQQGKVRFVYSLNRAADEARWSPPYILKEKDLAVGAYNLSWLATPDGSGNREQFNFTVAKAPVVTPTTQIVGANFGTNLIGADYASGDPVAHPQLPAALKALNMGYVRTWQEEPELARVGDKYWTINRAWQAAGFKTGLQVQFTNNKGMWPDHGSAMASRIIAGKAIDVVFLGNEVNTQHGAADPGTYYLGSESDLTAYCSTVGPMFEAAGIIAVAPSRINDLDGIVGRYHSGAYGPIRAYDLHLYSNDEHWLAKQFTEYATFCDDNNVQGFVTEFNLRMLKGETMASWTQRLATLLNAIKNLPIVMLQFSAFPTAHPVDDEIALLDSGYQPRTLAAWKAVLNP